MTLSITAVRMTSNVSPHTAKGFPDGWRVTWLGDRTVDYNLAVTAMMIADTIADPSEFATELGGDAYVRSLAAELGLTTVDAKRMVAETLPSTYVHQALVSDGAPPRPWCGGVGRSVMRKAEVTCPDCLQLDTDRKARTEVHDAHAIPAADEPEPAKTHELSIRRTSNGNVVIEVDNETDDYTVYLLDGAAQDLGRALAALTPAQRQVLIDDLAGGVE